MTAGRTAGRGQQAILGTAAAANKAAVILMGTVMAVYVGRAGSAFAASLVTAVYFFGLMVFSPIWGGIADVTGRHRLVLIVTSGCTVLAILPLTVVAGVWLPLLFRLLFAVFAAAFLPVGLAIVSDRVGGSNRGAAVGIFNSASAVGFMAGQFASGALIDFFARPVVYVILAGVAGIVTVAAIFIANPEHQSEESVSRTELIHEIRGRLLPRAGSSHLRRNGLRWLYVASFLRNMTVLGFVTLLPVYFVQEIGMTPAVMGLILGVNPTVQILGMYVFGTVTDLIGRKPVIVAGYAGSGLYALILATATTPDTVVLRAIVAGVGMVVLGVAFSAVQTGVITFIGDSAPADRESELIGLRWTARGLGGVIAPPLFGGSVVLVGFEATFAAASVLSLTAAVLVALKVAESHEPTVGGDLPGLG